MDYSKGISTLYRAWVYLWIENEKPLSDDIFTAILIIRSLRLQLIDEREEVQAS